MEQQAYSQKANIRAFQQDAINRYRNPDPWSFLANIAGGMSASKSTNLAQAFGYGVAMASNAQDTAKEKALADYDALAKEEETINNNLDLMHYRNATTLGTVLDRQSGLQQTNLTKLQEQRNKLLADQNKVAKELNAKTPFEILSNQDDFDARAIQESRAYVQRLHPLWNTQRVTMEERALGLLSQAGDPFDSTKYPSALDQLNDKHKDIAGQVTVAPQAAAGTLNPKLLKYTYISQTPFLDGRNYKGKLETQMVQQAEAANIPYLGKDQMDSLDNIETAQRNFDSMEQQILPLLPRDAAGRILGGALGNTIEASAQMQPILSSFKAWRAAAIESLRAAAGSKGLRINEAEIKLAMDNDVPTITDTVGTAMNKMAIMRRMIQNQEDTLFRRRIGKAPPPTTSEAAGAQIPSASTIPTAPAPGKYMHNNREIIPQGDKWVYKDTGEGVK
jgi:hypothetical protein